MKILVTTDGSSDAAAAIALMQRLVGHENREFVLLSISDPRDVAMISAPIPGAIDLLLENLDLEARKSLREHARLFPNVEAIELLHRQGDAADVILQTAEQVGANLIVMGSRGLGPLSGPLLGSVSHRVAAHSQCSVLLGRRDELDFEDGFKILLAVDGSPHAKAASQLLGGLPLQPADEVCCVQVLTLIKTFRMDIVQKLSPIWVQEKELAEKNLESAVQQLRNGIPAGVSSALLEGENAGQVISHYAEENAIDLVVVGNRGLGTVQRFLMGSVSSYLLYNAPCGVLIVKEKGSPLSYNVEHD